MTDGNTYAINKRLNDQEDWDALQEVTEELEQAEADNIMLIGRIEELEDELHTMKTAGIIEVAIRNPDVSEYMAHWERRAEGAEAKLAKAAAELEEAWKVPKSDASYGILQVMIKYTLAELKGQ
jgi:hypothetical protein